MNHAADVVEPILDQVQVLAIAELVEALPRSGPCCIEGVLAGCPADIGPMTPPHRYSTIRDAAVVWDGHAVRRIGCDRAEDFAAQPRAAMNKPVLVANGNG